MVELIRRIQWIWEAVWPNLLASALWQPLTYLHITRSNRKYMRLYVGSEVGPDKEA